MLSSESGKRLYFTRAHAGSELYEKLDGTWSVNNPEMRTALARRGFQPADIYEGLESSIDFSNFYGTGTNAQLAASAAHFPAIQVLFLGTCLTQFAEDAVHAEGVKQQVDAIIAQRWLTTESLRQTESEKNDMVILQPGSQPLLDPMFKLHEFHEIRRYAASLGALVARWVERLAQRSEENCVLIVHSIAKPAFWPPNLDCDQWQEAWNELNAPIREAVDREPRVYLLDEEKLAYQYGALNIFDDSIFPWAHHGGATDITTNAPNQLNHVHENFAREYWAIWRGAVYPSIKAVVCDLDGVIWPGVMAEEGFSWLEEDTNRRWIHIGIQEALSTIERSGVVLASLSKGDEKVTLDAWSKIGKGMPLLASQFVEHSITWQPKVERMRDIMEILQVTPDRVLFIDDHPVERAAISTAFPEITVLGADLTKVRMQILTNPQILLTTRGSFGSRTISTSSSVSRMRDRRMLDDAAFLEQLNIQTVVRPATKGDIKRVNELIERTTQFSLSHPVKPSYYFKDQDNSNTPIMVLEARDRFADYGLVGVSIIDLEKLKLVAYSVSCRVLGLNVSDRLLNEHMQACGLEELEVALSVTARNTVIRETLAGWNLRQNNEGAWIITRKRKGA